MCSYINNEFSSLRNERYRAKFNSARPAFIARNGKDFALGDPMIHAKNDYSRLVFNGNIGVVKKVPDYEKKGFGDGDLKVEIEFKGERHTYTPDLLPYTFS